jgi:hypothetical protein
MGEFKTSVVLHVKSLMPPRFNVVTTVRSQTKGDWILKAHPGLSQEKLSYAVVEDIAKEGAFDEV